MAQHFQIPDMQKDKARTRTVVFSVLLLLVVIILGLIWFAKKQLPPDVAARSTSPLDVAPLLIDKLQQMVLQSSDSLYRLDIQELQTHIFSSEVQALQVSLVPDTVVLARLDKARRAPHDVFTLSFDTLRITGINVTDFLHKKDISLDTIFFSSPRIRIAHTDRPYNAGIRRRDSAMTLYQRLSQQFSSLSIGAIIARNGDVVSANLSQKDKTTALHHVGISLSNIRIDSLTQYDTSRFLFSKAADFTCRDYIASSADSLYTFQIASLSVSADQHRLIIKGLSLEPRGGKATFQRKLKTRNDMFTVRFPEIVADDIDWWALVNRQSLYAGSITLNGGLVKDYFDRTPPRSGKPTPMDNYPHQMLKEVSFPVIVKKMTVKGLDVVYEEFNPDVQKSGVVSFNGIAGTVANITNVDAQIKATPEMTSSLTARFMDRVPMTASFGFNLAKVRSGAFTATFHLGTIPNTLLNPMSEPLGLYTLRSGTVDEATVSVAGDNHTSTTGITLLYHDLSIYPLKVTDNGKTKERSLTGFLANTFAIKDANPSGNKEPRHLEVPVTRDKMGGSYFNFLWQSVLTGIVKTVGLPKKFADQ